MTNSVPAAAVLSQQEGRSVWLLGGQVRGITQAVVGPPALETLARLRVDVAFLGTNGLSLRRGLTTPDPGEALAKAAMVAAARRAIVLTDSSKVGDEHFSRFADLKDIAAVITDSRLDDETAQLIENEGPEVIRA